jgi:hypothetical protein
MTMPWRGRSARRAVALQEILHAARDPQGLVRRQLNERVTQDGAHSFALGWIEAIARDALGVPPATIGWLAEKRHAPTCNTTLGGACSCADEYLRAVEP